MMQLPNADYSVLAFLGTGSCMTGKYLSSFFSSFFLGGMNSTSSLPVSISLNGFAIGTVTTTDFLYPLPRLGIGMVTSTVESSMLQ